MNALGTDDLDRLRAMRRTDPHRVVAALARRPRRPLLPSDGRLLLVAADHPARGALGVGSASAAMASRPELLARLAEALRNPAVDGVLGTPDVLDDLAALGLLDDRLAVGSMNRGGLQGAAFEMDDRFTAYEAAGAVAAGIDMLKTLLRVDLADAGTAATLESTARAVTAAARAGVPIMVEPFISRRRDGCVVNDLSLDAVLRSIAIAAGLGSSSAFTWLKLPVIDEMERVMESTTLPTLLLGGEPTAAPDDVYARWGAALTLPGVVGLVVGRTLLYPPDDDVASAVDTAARLVHDAGPAR